MNSFHLVLDTDTSATMTALQSALAPFTLKGFYLLTWGTALGTNVWNTLVSPLSLVPLRSEIGMAEASRMRSRGESGMWRVVEERVPCLPAWAP